MLIRYVLEAALVLGGCRCLAQSGFPDHCSDGSPLPFASIKVKQAIDSTCGLSGAPTATANSKLQNEVKDNFCAGMGGKTPETLTPQMLAYLQAFRSAAAHRTGRRQAGADESLPSRRSSCEPGRGRNRELQRGCRIAKRHPHGHGSDGEHPGMRQRNDGISPHYRPASWNEIGHFERYHPATKKYTPDPGMAARPQAHAYRITGQLFFDASHTVCPCGTSCTPARSSLWEIHPLYAIEVCKSGTACDENSDSDWMAFDTWWNSMVPLKKLRGPHAHPNSEPH
jgi:hypothetical protein